MSQEHPRTDSEEWAHACAITGERPVWATVLRMLCRYDALDRLTQVCYGACPGGGGGGGASAAAVIGPTCIGCGGSAVINRPPVNNPPPAGDTFTTWTYDPLGNRLTEVNYLGTTTSASDLADRLVSTTVGTTTETYSYSGDGIRLSAATGSQAARTVRYLVDRTLGEGSVAIERDGANKTLRRYAYRHRRPGKAAGWSRASIDRCGMVTLCYR